MLLPPCAVCTGAAEIVELVEPALVDFHSGVIVGGFLEVGDKAILVPLVRGLVPARSAELPYVVTSHRRLVVDVDLCKVMP